VDRLLIEYLPIVLREVPEFEALLTAWQPEAEALWDAQDDALENQFLLSATDYGISRWERILQIFPKDTDGLEMRRARVLSILRLKLPYTMRWLRNWLTELCGAGNFGLDITKYLIMLDLGLDNIPEAEKLADDLMALLQIVKPANMILDYNGMRQSTGTLLVGAVSGMAVEIDVWPTPDELISHGGVQVRGYTEYIAVIETFPIT